MARPRGSKNKPKTQPTPAMGDNIEAFSDDQRFALAMHHVRIIRKAEAEKKEADATFKNKWKVAKADGVQDVVKAVFALEKDGIDPIQARIELELRTAAKMGIHLDMPAGLFDKPSDGQAYLEGRVASMRGDPASPPYGPDTADYMDWMKGFDAGTTLIAAVSEPKPTAEIIPAEDEDEPPAAPASDSFDDSMEDEPDAAEVRVARQDWKDSTRSHIRDFDETARTLEAKFDNEAPAFLDRN